MNKAAQRFEKTPGQDAASIKPVGKGTLEHTESGTPFIKRENGEAFQLHDATAFLWKECDGNKSIKEITRKVYNRLGRPEKLEKMEHEIIKSVKQLRNAGFAEFRSGPNEGM